jgi:hypothetical protein
MSVNVESKGDGRSVTPRYRGCDASLPLWRQDTHGDSTCDDWAGRRLPHAVRHSRDECVAAGAGEPGSAAGHGDGGVVRGVESASSAEGGRGGQGAGDGGCGRDVGGTGGRSGPFRARGGGRDDGDIRRAGPGGGPGGEVGGDGGIKQLAGGSGALAEPTGPRASAADGGDRRSWRGVGRGLAAVAGAGGDASSRGGWT